MFNFGFNLHDRIRRIAVLFSVVFVAACEFEMPPMVSATVESYVPGIPVHQKTLASEQSQALDTWFARHKKGWSSSPASYVPTLLVRARHSNGEVSVINVLSTMVVVNIHGEQYVQQFPPRELASLQDILMNPP